MRIGQTSAVVFFAKVLSSALGFVGTIYFARTLGPEIIGIYASIVALITWLQLGGKVGVHGALTKRLSEGENRGQYMTAGLIVVGAASTVMVSGILLFRSFFETYVAEFSVYTDVSVSWFVVALFVLQVAVHITNSILQGQHLVHVVGLLRPVRTGLINGTQFALEQLVVPTLTSATYAPSQSE
jgi:O-antigen/teichoic acid export membrane protein